MTELEWQPLCNCFGISPEFQTPFQVTSYIFNAWCLAASPLLLYHCHQFFTMPRFLSVIFLSILKPISHFSHYPLSLHFSHSKCSEFLIFIVQISSFIIHSWGHYHLALVSVPVPKQLLLGLPMTSMLLHPKGIFNHHCNDISVLFERSNSWLATPIFFKHFLPLISLSYFSGHFFSHSPFLANVTHTNGINCQP